MSKHIVDKVTAEMKNEKRYNAINAITSILYTIIQNSNAYLYTNGLGCPENILREHPDIVVTSPNISFLLLIIVGFGFSNSKFLKID